MFVWIWGPRQVAVGAVILVGPVGGAAVVLGIGRGAVVLVRAGLNVAAVVFRHLRKIKGRLGDYIFSFEFTSVSLTVAAKHGSVTRLLCHVEQESCSANQYQAQSRERHQISKATNIIFHL